MRLTIIVLSIALAGTAFDAAAQSRTRYVDVVNRAHDSVTSVTVAATGGGAAREIPLRRPVRGGGGSTTVAVAGDGCLYDFRFAFRDGRTMVQPNVNVCRSSVLRIRKLPRDADSVRALADRR